MSETVHYKGKLELVKKIEGETIEDVYKRILNEYGFNELPCYCVKWSEAVSNKLYMQYVLVNDDVYKVLTREDIDEYAFFNISDNQDGTYDYDVMYYNGACGLEEAIEIGFEEMSK